MQDCFIAHQMLQVFTHTHKEIIICSQYILCQDEKNPFSITEIKEIDKIIKDAEQNAKDDEKRRANIELKNNAETICYTAEKKLNEENSNISESEKESINNIISEIRDLIKKEDFDSLEQKMKELEQLMSTKNNFTILRSISFQY